LIFPLNFERNLKYPLPLSFAGLDVTERLKIVHFTKTVETSDKKSPWPISTPKTDQPNLRSVPAALHELQAADEVVITLKMDGTSSTYYLLNGDFGVCSRNFKVQADNDKKRLSCYFDIAKKVRFFFFL